MNDNPKELTKRVDCYIQEPPSFCISGCPQCQDTKNIVWSEFEDHVWCPECEIDYIPEHWGILDGPVCVQICGLMGISFDRFRIDNGAYLRWDTEQHDWIEDSTVYLDQLLENGQGYKRLDKNSIQ